MSSEIITENESLLELRKELLADTIASRLKLLVLAETPEKRRFPTLEKVTEVNENTWRTWWNRGGVPGGILIAGAGRAWPEYAFWLTTGLTDVEYGHRMPQLHFAVQGYLSNWPEGSLRKDRLYAAEYFKVCRELQNINKQGQEHPPTQQSEILKNTKEFITKKRFEEIAKGVKWDRWSGNEE